MKCSCSKVAYVHFWCYEFRTSVALYNFDIPMWNDVGLPGLWSLDESKTAKRMRFHMVQPQAIKTVFVFLFLFRLELKIARLINLIILCQLNSFWSGFFWQLTQGHPRGSGSVLARRHLPGSFWCVNMWRGIGNRKPYGIWVGQSKWFLPDPVNKIDWELSSCVVIFNFNKHLWGETRNCVGHWSCRSEKVRPRVNFLRHPEMAGNYLGTEGIYSADVHSAPCFWLTSMILLSL